MSREIEFNLTVTAEEPRENDSPARRLRFSGVAVSSALNRKNIEFTERAMHEMSQFKNVPICIGSHRDARENPDSTIGLTDDFKLTEDDDGNLQLAVEGYLFSEDDRATRLHDKMMNYPSLAQGVGMSVSGKPGDGGLQQSISPDGEPVTKCDNWVDFNHILVCRRDAAADGRTNFGVDQTVLDWGAGLIEATMGDGRDEIEITNEQTEELAEFLFEAVPESVPAAIGEEYLLVTSDGLEVTVETKDSDEKAGAGVVVLAPSSCANKAGDVVVWRCYNPTELTLNGNKYTVISVWSVMLTLTGEGVGALDQTVSLAPWAPHLATEDWQFLFTPDEDKATWKLPVRDVEGRINLHAVEQAVTGFDELDATTQEAVRGKLAEIVTKELRRPLPECLQEVTASADAEVDQSEQVSHTEEHIMEKRKYEVLMGLFDMAKQALYGASDEVSQTDTTEAAEPTDDTTEATEETTEEQSEEVAEEATEQSEETTEETVEQDAGSEEDALVDRIAERVVAKMGANPETTEDVVAEQTEAVEETTEEVVEQTVEDDTIATLKQQLVELTGVVEQLTAPVSGQGKLSSTRPGASEDGASEDLLGLGRGLKGFSPTED